ncbi:T9SS type A sorting domain-containing protein [Flavobacterium amnicola]|uniref:T9SS type A sorting domain-containing protein n=1 Tax=Flavobacterium amnicola TaxID=2506422 RepID=A0A4Q1K3L5_9FLAO|nr:T9SS type A sorting domain-containing protein [Flavobacterium amnicola]RXR17338.1 T9SS type A sorting domain-containing protein [Flavobacterium amnicola]
MNKITFLVFSLLLFTVNSHSQTKITFDYDSAGNQIVRRIVFSRLSDKTTDETTKEEQKTNELEEQEKINDNDFQKFNEEDVFSYYPNPVKEKLFLKWELINNNKVESIDIYTLNGNLLKNYGRLSNENFYSIDFQNYPLGTYILLINYNNGDSKSIKIVKN